MMMDVMTSCGNFFLVTLKVELKLDNELLAFAFDFFRKQRLGVSQKGNVRTHYKNKHGTALPPELQ